MKAFALLVLSVVTVSALAQQKPAPRVLLERQIAAYCKAMEAKDRKAIEGILANDFKTTNMVGQVAQRKQVLDGLSGLFKQVKSIKIACKIQKFKMEKGNARIVVLNELDIMMTDQSGKPGKLTNVSTSDEVWVPVNGVFKAKSSKQLTNIATFNGKVVHGG
jgi:Cdc6-like AAA superfamily ATPase